MCEASFSSTSLKTTCPEECWRLSVTTRKASSRPPPMCRTSLMSSHGHSFSTPSGQNSSLRPRSFLYSACIRHLPPGREWSLRSADFPFAPETEHPLREPASFHHTSASQCIIKTARACPECSFSKDALPLRAGTKHNMRSAVSRWRVGCLHRTRCRNRFSKKPKKKQSTIPSITASRSFL